jgi:hypothetical protein
MALELVGCSVKRFSNIEFGSELFMSSQHCAQVREMFC